MMKKKNIWMIVLAIIIILIVVLTYANNQNKETIKIGALYPLTGGLAQYGEVTQKSSEIAIDDINSKGGINGKKLEIDFQDHQCDSQTAVTLFEQMVSVKNIKIFSGVACSGTILSIAPKLKENNALLFGTIVTTPKITGVSPYVFRNWGSDDKEAKLMSEEIRKRGYKKLAIIYEETDYAKGIKLSLDKYLNNSNVKIMSESFTSDSTDVRTQLSKLKSQNPDSIFISPQTVTSGDRVIKQMIEINFKPKQIFINDNVVKSLTLLQSYKDFLEGAIGGDYVPDLNKSQEFLQKYKEKYNEDCTQPNVGAAVYDAINLLADAIKEKGYDAEGVREYLKSVNYEGISGNISFDSNNDRNNADYSLFIVKGGKAVKIN